MKSVENSYALASSVRDLNCRGIHLRWSFSLSLFDQRGSSAESFSWTDPFTPPSGWSGGTLVPPWTYPGTIDHLPDPLFDQALLSKSVFSGVSALCRCSGLDVKGWMLGLGCSVFPTRRSSFAVCLRCPAPFRYAWFSRIRRVFTRSSLGVV